MSELTFKSAGVSTREIDLSQPSVSGPRGVPAGVIGTAVDGPAFVPITVASYQEFASVFGNTDGDKFGPLAVAEYLKSAQALTYIRILGVGDGKKRNATTGVVTNAGFTVGEKQVQTNGIVAANPHSNSEIGGRTYFLGCFMQDASNSTLLKDAGIQKTGTATRATATIEITDAGQITANNQISLVTTSGDTVTITGHADTNAMTDTTGPSTNGTFAADTTLSGGSSNNIIQATAIAATINLHEDFTATSGGTATVTITQNTRGQAGNTTITVAKNGGNGDIESPGDVTITQFSGGADGDHAVPIVRGVLMAANGVVLSISTGSAGSASTAPENNTVYGNPQALWGSVILKNQNFSLLMHGLKGTTEKKTLLTASFDVQSPSYFSNVLNTDPFKLEQEGHLLYAHYDIHPNMATLTGSGATIPLHKTAGESSYSAVEDVAFLLTGSNSRGQSANLSNIPDYEDFKDRFTHAETSNIFSQDNKNLFKLVALSPGEGISNKIKYSIENLKPGNLTKNQYAAFDLIIRELEDTDDNKIPLETYRNINLDPGSDRYIGRVIGDNNVFFDFDSNPETQKILVEGSHPNRSKYVRVVLGSDVTNKNIQVTDLPVGFRGHKHLVTSGSNNMAAISYSQFLYSDIHKRVVEPPIPYRENLSFGTGLNKKVDARLYWGTQTARKIDPSDPNKLASFDKSFFSFTKHFPTHRKDTTAFAVASDTFNNNKFSLLNIKVRTGSDGLADPDMWVSSSYSRDGSGLTAVPASYTRGLKIDESKNDLDRVANRKYLKFTGFFQGGFDGSNIFNKDKQKFLNNAAKREIDDTTNQGGTAGPTVSAYRKAVDIMESKSDVDIQLLAIPGARHSSITDYAISAVENRFDAVYIMDIEERDQVDGVVTSSADQVVSVTNTVKSFKNRGLDSSFAAAYFPDVNVVDPTTRAIVQAPPSVSVLGAYGLNDKLGHPWFAPAGFTRGALSAVDNTSVYLNRDNLDDLYEADINPIASFPGTGITIWGQKTLLQSQSALDRINVRRLLINVRRKVRNIANSLLFEPNREETLERFSALVNPILQRVQTLSGVERYKVVIDTSTTTQADVENNTIRGKIFLQPTRTVEFVALDFVVTNAGSNLL